MNYIIAGIFSGIIMASVTLSVVPFTIFLLAKNPTPGFKIFLARVPPIYITMGLVIVSYPLCILVGGIAGLLYSMSINEFPRAGLGSQNMAFSITTVVFGIGISSTLVFLLRQAYISIAILTLVFVGNFGWILPFLAKMSV